MRINRIDHINLRTPLLRETLRFYEDLLGLKAGYAPGMDPDRIAWLYDETEAAIIHVNMPSDGEQVAAADGTGRLDHVAFDCDGHDELVERLNRMGLDYTTSYVQEIDLRQIFVFDPNGVRLELNFRGGASLRRAPGLRRN
jgi:catechol 2,3-dioxygenase-like lactoylglutathione lyase family enzyme